MIEITELIRWLKTLESKHVAVDDGGLSLVEVQKDGTPSEAYLEIGGTPEQMTLKELKAAVLAGEKVHWQNEIYEVRHHAKTGFYIICTTNNNSVGLHEPTYFPNGKSIEFFIA